MICFKNNPRGFIALFSVIIISFMLIIVAVTLSLSGFSGRFNVFDSESKERSNSLADACIESARLAIALKNYDLNEEVKVDVDGEECIYKILPGGSEIIAWAITNSAHTYYAVKVNTNESKIPICDFQELLTEDDAPNLSCP